MVVNFRARGISRGARKLARTPTKKKLITCYVQPQQTKAKTRVKETADMQNSETNVLHNKIKKNN